MKYGKSVTLAAALSLTTFAAARGQNPRGAAMAPDMKRVIDALVSLHGKPIETLSAQEARQQPTPPDAVRKVLMMQHRDTTATSLIPGVTSRDTMIDGAAGRIAARIFTPAGVGPFPVILYFHGGGWVIGSKEVYDAGARGISKGANAIVVSIDYRLAPEAKFPAQHDDAFAAYRWVLMHGKDLGGNGKTALAGESAGGNLAVATAIAARDARVQMPVHILSVYPIAQPDTSTASYVQNMKAKPLNRPMMTWFFNNTQRTPADRKDPRIDLVHANLRGLPATTIITAEIDPLHSDGTLLTGALQRAGVAVQHRHFTGVTHEFFGMAAVVAKAKEAQAYAAARLKASLK